MFNMSIGQNYAPLSLNRSENDSKTNYSHFNHWNEPIAIFWPQNGQKKETWPRLFHQHAHKSVARCGHYSLLVITKPNWVQIDQKMRLKPFLHIFGRKKAKI